MQIIGKTSEWQRINAIPTRPNNAHSPVKMSYYRQMGLTPDQSRLLYEIEQNKGGVGCIGVGGGKSFVSPLIPFAVNSQKPLLIVPAQLKVQTETRVLPLHQNMGFPIHPNLRIESYHWISSIKGADFLESYQPDLIIFDEVHKLKNPKSARTKRVLRYFRKFPQTIFVGLSGTITKNSLLDYYHIFMLALGNRSPLPNNYQEVELWDKVLSPKAENDYYENVHPGVLYDWHPTDPRSGYQRKLRSTPGIVFSQQQECDASIYLHVWLKPIETWQLQKCRDDWELPNGEPICDSLVYYQKIRQLASGFYYDYVVKPPEEWIEKRRKWLGLAKQVIKYNRQKIDTLGQLEQNALSLGIPEYVEWKEIEKSYTPIISPKWFSTKVLNFVLTSISKQQSLIWCDTDAFGRMMEYCKIPFFGQGMNKELQDFAENPGDQSICLSMHAHSEGKNLQKFNHNIVVTPPANALMWEQIIGRTHRKGQEADEIHFLVMCHTPELLYAFKTALMEAHYIKTTTGQEQKLLLATITTHQ
jgi:hypothetical protein